MPTADLVEEAAKTTAAAALAAVPVVGGSMSVFFSDAYAATEKFEMENWLRKVAEAVDSLAAQRKVTPETLVSDPVFRAALFKHLRLARETAREEKLQILANAACNSGSWSSNHESLNDYFGRVLERYAPEHVLMLSAFDDPQQFVAQHREGVGNGQLHWILANVVFKGIVEWDVLSAPILRDLYRDGFVVQHYGVGFPLAEESRKLSTPLGNQFLMHCEAPYWEDVT